MSAADRLNGYQFHIGYTHRSKGGNPVVAGVHIQALTEDGDEAAGSLSFRRIKPPEGASGRHFAGPSVSVEPDHEQKGLASEMVRRLTAMSPGTTFHWHDFTSDGGLGVAKRAVADNPEQHILHEDFVRGPGE